MLIALIGIFSSFEHIHYSCNLAIVSRENIWGFICPYDIVTKLNVTGITTATKPVHLGPQSTHCDCLHSKIRLDSAHAQDSYRGCTLFSTVNWGVFKSACCMSHIRNPAHARIPR